MQVARGSTTCITIPFSVYIHDLTFVSRRLFPFLSECSEKSLGSVVILPLVCISYFIANVF